MVRYLIKTVMSHTYVCILVFNIITCFLVAIGAINVSAPAHFSEGVSPGLLTSVNCSGSQERILDCGHISSSRGLSCKTAGVVCQGIVLVLPACCVDAYVHVRA